MDPQSGYNQGDEGNVDVQESLVESVAEGRPAREEYGA